MACFRLNSTVLLIVLGIMKNFLSSERGQLLYLFLWQGIKPIIVIIEAYNSYQ
jgi:hypothetical protein